MGLWEVVMWAVCCLFVVVRVLVRAGLVRDGARWVQRRFYRPPRPAPRLDRGRLAALEHDLMPRELWTPDAHTVEVCADCRWAVVAPPSGVLQVGRGLSESDLRELERQFQLWTTHAARPTVIVTGPDAPDVQVIPGQVWVDTRQEPDESGPK